MSNKLYKCSKCGKKKQGFEFSLRSNGKPASRCKLCATKVAKESYGRRKDEVLSYQKEYRKANRDSIAAYREENKDRTAAYNKEYHKANRDKSVAYREENKDSIAAYNKEYRKANRASCNARSSLRRASKLQRTPKWLTATDISKIKSIYKIARALSKKTGTPHHVDHVIPLQGELVSGLHCPTNLQVIPASENLSKSNKYSV